MSKLNVADMTVGELVEEFRRLADALGEAWDFSVRPERYRRTPERAARVARMNVLAPELARRASPDVIEGLLLDPSRDVRSWSSGRFHSFHDDLARAAVAGLMENVSTQEALNEITHARKPPPASPPLAGMTVDDLLARFTDACRRKFWSQHAGRDDLPYDIELRNAIIGQNQKTVEELRKRGALDRLIPFLDSADVTLRVTAACSLLRTEPERAVKVLEQASTLQGDFLIAGDASIALSMRHYRPPDAQPSDSSS